MQSKEPFGVSIRKTKDTKKEGQKGLFHGFLDPSSPGLAFGSPRPLKDFNVNKPARLGELQLAWASSLLHD